MIHAGVGAACADSPVFGSPGVFTAEAATAAEDVELLLPDPKPAHAGTVLIVSVVEETVPPKASARPIHATVLPMVMPDGSIMVPMNEELAPMVAAAFAVHTALHAEAPLAVVTIELSDVFSAPVDLKIKAPVPSSVIVPPPPTEAAPVIQYTPGA